MSWLAPSTPTIFTSALCCPAASAMPTAVGSFTPKKPSTPGFAVRMSPATFMLLSRVRSARWVATTVIPGLAAMASPQPFIRSLMAETAEPSTIASSPRPPSRPIRYLHASRPACTLSLVTVASAPAAATSTATTGIFACLARSTAGPMPSESTASTMIASTRCRTNVSILSVCALTSALAYWTETLTPRAAAASWTAFPSARKKGLDAALSTTPIEVSASVPARTRRSPASARPAAPAAAAAANRVRRRGWFTAFMGCPHQN
ncbi:hypothetical protein LUX32_49510 [Actinomadura madurae]|nr:hypothetical protein [Actinomadura madurae]MCP9984682.1 hypothetical protein [Actinomadura madurae]